MNNLLVAIVIALNGNPYRARFMDVVNANSAWSYTRGDSSVTVGIIDMGFDFFHPDLRDVLSPGYFADGAYHTEIYEIVAHGTMAASVIHSLAPGCGELAASTGVIKHRLLILKKQFDREHPDGDIRLFQKEMVKHASELSKFAVKWQSHVERATAEGIRYLVDHGAKVINISGLLKKSAELDSAFSYAADHDVVIVIGAGNSASEYEDYPGEELKNIIVVGATKLNDERWTETVNGIQQGSNYGSRLTVVAPCESIIVAAPHEERFYRADDSPMGPEDMELSSIRDTVECGATSLATAVVSGLAALVRSLRPDLTAAEVVEVIKKGAHDIGDPGFDPYTGDGRVDFGKTIDIVRRWSK